MTWPKRATFQHTWPVTTYLPTYLRTSITEHPKGPIIGICDIWDTDYNIWQLRTRINDNLCYLTINCDTGQHSQFLRCFCWSPNCMKVLQIDLAARDSRWYFYVNASLPALRTTISDIDWPKWKKAMSHKKLHQVHLACRAQLMEKWTCFLEPLYPWGRKRLHRNGREREEG